MIGGALVALMMQLPNFSCRNNRHFSVNHDSHILLCSMMSLLHEYCRQSQLCETDAYKVTQSSEMAQRTEVRRMRYRTLGILGAEFVEHGIPNVLTDGHNKPIASLDLHTEAPFELQTSHGNCV